MAQTPYFMILTDRGRAKVANAIAQRHQITLTEMAVGDGGGSAIKPRGDMAALVREVYRAGLNQLTLDADNPSYVVADLVIPVTTGGFYIREAGIFDEDGDLFAVGSLPESYKPVLAEGAGTDFYVRLILDVQNADAVTLKVDPSIVLASQDYVQEQLKGYVPTGRRVDTVYPLEGGGALTKDLTISLPTDAEEGEILVFRGGAWGKEKLPSSTAYEIGEFYYFRHPTLRKGFLPAQGSLITNAAELYPEVWAYLQTSEGQLLCTTEAEWQHMNTAIWHTNADGSKVGWEGIGGAPFYVLNTSAGSLRLPDLRGMYVEAAGYDSLSVGGVHGDGMRRLHGVINYAGENDRWYFTIVHTATMDGVFAPNWEAEGNNITPSSVYSSNHPTGALFDSGRVVPISAKVQPRAWGALACVYLGAPNKRKQERPRRVDGFWRLPAQYAKGQFRLPCTPNLHCYCLHE